MKKPVDVYLLGGTKSGWQNQIRLALRKLSADGLVRWNDPRDDLTSDAEWIKLLNTLRIKTADIVFVNERDKGSNLEEINRGLALARFHGKAIVILTNSPGNFLNYEHPEYRTDKDRLAINMLETMIYAMAGEK